VTDGDPDVSASGARVTDSQPQNHAQRDGVTDVSDKSQDLHTTNGHHEHGCLVDDDSSACVNSNCKVFGMCVMTENEPALIP
jgi:hypothetical protein